MRPYREIAAGAPSAAAVLLVTWGLAARPAAAPLALHVVPDSSRVRYHISHTLSDVTDLAGTPSGEAEVEGEGDSLGLTGRVQVDLRALRTGIGRRDRHVKSEDCLDVERYPACEFVLQGVAADTSAAAAADAASPRHWSGRGRGTLSLHGVERELEVPMHLWWLDVPGQGGIRLRGDFTIQLADFGIKRPKKLMLAAGKSVDVHLDLVFAP